MHYKVSMSRTGFRVVCLGLRVWGNDVDQLIGVYHAVTLNPGTHNASLSVLNSTMCTQTLDAGSICLLQGLGWTNA